METWKEIPGYEEYEASTEGRIRSLDRVKPFKSKYGMTTRKYRGRVLNPAPHSKAHPYPYVQLGRGVSRAVHFLVALAYHGERPEGHQVLHGDGDCTNCKPENLSYGSPQDNQIDRFLHGTHFGEATGSKLKEIEVKDIKARLAAGDQQKDIAADYGINQTSVSHIKTGRNWSWL